MSEKLSIAELRRSPAYLTLTQKQRRLVEVFLETGDKVKAIASVYSCSEKSARAMAHAYFRKPRILAVLTVANGSAPEVGNADVPQKFSIGSIIVQDGKKFRVTAEELEQ
jgi:hypothetical protein